MPFTLEAYRKLKQYLGEIDAIVEINELANRKFIELAKNSDNVDNFIKENSKRLGVKVDTSNLSLLSTKMAQNYIVIVYQSAEFFLKDFKSEYETIYKLEPKSKGKENWFDLTLKYLPLTMEEKISKIGKHRIKIFNYYQVVRNKITHRFSFNGERIESAFGAIDAFRKEITEEYKTTNAPNKFDKINFEDFILFSRVTKDIAFSICQIVKPNNTILKDSINLKKFNKFLENPERMRFAMMGELRTRFGFDNEEADLITSEILAH